MEKKNFLDCARRAYTPEYQYADGYNQVRCQRTDRRHLDELIEIEHGRQYGCGKSVGKKY